MALNGFSAGYLVFFSTLSKDLEFKATFHSKSLLFSGFLGNEKKSGSEITTPEHIYTPFAFLDAYT